MSSLCLAVALGSALPTGNLPAQAEELGVSNEAIFLSIALFVVGFGMGPLVFAPLSEMIGRNPVYVISMFYYFMFTLPSALAHNIGTMLVCQLIAGTASSAPMTNVGGTIARHLGRTPSAARQWPSSPDNLHGDVCADLVEAQGGEVEQGARRDGVYKSDLDLRRVPLSTTLKIALTRPFIFMFCEPIVLCKSIYLSFIYSLLYLLFFAFPIAFEGVRGWNEGMTGTSFIAVMLGILFAFIALQYQQVCTNAQPSTGLEVYGYW